MRRSVLTSAVAGDPLPTLLVGLTMTTGLVDAISLLGLGGVFTANMTGNVVFLGFASAGTPGFSVSRSAAALASFLVGALVAGRLGTSLKSGTRRRWLLSATSVEAVMLIVAGLIATDYDRATLAPAERLYMLIVLLGLAMGLRNATVRQLGVPDLTTTVLTLALTGLAADSSLAGRSNPRWGRRIASVAAIFVGAAIGAALVNAMGLVVPLEFTAAIVILLTGTYALHPTSKLGMEPAH